MTYLASFIIIGVKGLFRSDIMGAGLVHSWERERWENSATPSAPIEVSYRQIWKGLLTLLRLNCHITHTSLLVAQLLLSSQIQKKLLQIVYFIIMCHIYK
jgi:hypothetical protein